jgi:hypothetical protein
MLVDTSGDDWSIEFANEAWEEVVGLKRVDGLRFWNVFKVGQAAAAFCLRCTEVYLSTAADTMQLITCSMCCLVAVMVGCWVLNGERMRLSDTPFAGNRGAGGHMHAL